MVVKKIHWLCKAWPQVICGVADKITENKPTTGIESWLLLRTHNINLLKSYTLYPDPAEIIVY